MGNWQRKSHAAPSQAITWKLLGLSPDQRVCAICGKQVRLQDLAQYIVRVGTGEGVKLACNGCGPRLV